MSGKLVLVVLVNLWLGLCATVSPALGDGGTLRFSGRRGDRVVTVFTAPAPLRAGPIDLSVLVQDSGTGRPITDLPIEVHAQRIGHAKTTIRAAATTEAATNKLLRAARLELSAPGQWRFDVLVRGVTQSQQVGFDVLVAEPVTPWLQMIFWIAWPIVPIGLFALAQLRFRGAHSESRSDRQIVCGRSEHA
jgi:hypothetical protein